MNEAQAYHFIGLDVHKKTVVYCEKALTGETVEHGRIAATRKDLIEFARARRRPWVGGLEATMFSGWIYDVLAPYAVKLHVGHPLRLKALKKNKNDRIDAEMLANLLRAQLFPTCHMASPEVRELRRVLRYRNFMVMQTTRMKNKTSGLLMEVGAQYTKRKLHGKRYFSELLDKGLEDVPQSVRELLKMTHKSVDIFQQTQRTLLKALSKHPTLEERLERLKTVKGVGEVTALTWALEIDTPKRFSSIKDVQSYCGLCAAEHESAGKQRRMPLSKERNPHLQTILIEAAKLAPSFHPHLNAVYQKALNKPGGNRNRATLEVARKLAAYLLAVDKSGKDFVIPQA